MQAVHPLRIKFHLPTVFDLCAIALAQLLLYLVVRASGFSAISDDDYSRVVIAQDFVQAPSWDPSGTSWLPLPFLLTGSAMKLLGPTLSVARAASVVIACLSSITLYFAASLLGVARPWRLISTLIAMSLPYASYLAAATVPEYSTSAALVYGAASLSPCIKRLPGRSAKTVRVLGALAMGFACASRYEAWPATAVFAVWTARDLSVWEIGRTRQRFSLGIALFLSVLFPLAWLGYGSLHHDDPFFFVKRVVHYKQALGLPPPSYLELISDYPMKLFSGEPEIMFSLCSAGLVLIVSGRGFFSRSKLLSELLRPWSILLFLLFFLIVGASRGGAPTHHSERALLSLWLMSALSLGRLFSALKKSEQTRLALVCLLSTCVGLALRWIELSPRQAFVDRAPEEAIGALLKSEAPPTEEIAVLPPDYGYFALLAATGKPHRFVVFNKHDPRARNSDDSSSEDLRQWLKNGGCYFVTSSKHASSPSREIRNIGGLSLRLNAHCQR